MHLIKYHKIDEEDKIKIEEVVVDNVYVLIGKNLLRFQKKFKRNHIIK